MRKTNWWLETRLIAWRCSVAVLLLGSFLSALFAQQDPEAIVESFFPQRLADESNEYFAPGGTAPWRGHDFVLGDLEGTGTDEFIVAAYTNGASVVVRVLRLGESGATLAAETDDSLLIGGTSVTVTLMDLDGDGRPEIIERGRSFRGLTADWAFKWTGAGLELFSPSLVGDDGYVDTVLTEALFKDLDGDGKLEIVNTGYPVAAPPGVQPDTTDIYRLVDGRYERSERLSYFGNFYLRSDPPVVDYDQFPALEGMPHLMKIRNGDLAGENRITDAEVSLNDTVVVAAERFTGAPREIVQAVSVLRTNNLRTELRAPMDGQILIRVYAICDIDEDQDVDRDDIDLIMARRNMPASSPSDARDADGDGTITALDARKCIIQCTNPRCVVVE